MHPSHPSLHRSSNTRKHVGAAIRASVVYRANILSNGCLVSSTFKRGFILTRRVIKQGDRVGENLHETLRIALGSNPAGRGRVTHRGRAAAAASGVVSLEAL